MGDRMFRLIEELFPINRSITGDGFRETMRRIAREIPLDVTEVPSGTRVLDWTVPKEWNLRDAYVKDSRGQRVVDLAASNLHVMGYSTPVHRTMPLAELRDHLHTLPEQPTLIPYRTSYYSEAWGFCLAQEVLDTLPDGDYEVCIDSTLEDGSLTYGECFLEATDPGGTVAPEVLVSCHSCHPSLANDNLSGMSLAVELARSVAARPRRMSYRFLFIPGTIGSITWLARNESSTERIRHGLVVSCVGDGGGFTYKRSRRGDAVVDRAVEHVLGASGEAHEVIDFVPYGYDERQYCSPGFDLPVGCFMRTPNGRYPEYHTSADDLTLVRPVHLQRSYEVASRILDVLEHNARYRNTHPKGEPQLGRRGLYKKSGGHTTLPGYEMALLWVLNLSDGAHDLLAVAERSGLPFATVLEAADDLVAHGLLAPA